jgi:hypothetical protein
MGWLQKTLRLTILSEETNALPSGNVLHLGLAESAALGQLGDTSHGCGTVGGRLRHDIGKNLVEKVNNVTVDLLKLEQESIVTLGAVDALEARIWDTGSDLLLLCEGEKTIRFDTQDKSRLLHATQSLEDGVLRGRVGTVTGNIVRVKFASHSNVAIGVKSLDKLVTLITKVRLRRKVGRRTRTTTWSELRLLVVLWDKGLGA